MKQSIGEDGSEDKRRQYQYKVVKTVVLTVLWIATGLYVSLVGITLVDFRHILDTEFDHLGVTMVLRTVGYMVGCIFASQLQDKFRIKPELILVMFSLIAALVNFLKPWSRTVSLFGVLNSIGGIAHGSMNTVNNAFLLRLWGKKAALPVHMLHFGFGLGAFLGPLLAKDFLSKICPFADNANTSWSEYTENGNSSNILQGSELFVDICQNSTLIDPVVLRKSRVEIPFSIVGVLLTSVSLILLLVYTLENYSTGFRRTYLRPKSTNEKSELKKTPKSRFSFINSLNFKFIVALFLVYVCISSFETVVYNYLFTFAYESELGFSKPEAAYLSSAYWGFYTLGRLFASVISHCVSVKVMIFVEMSGSLGALLLMLLWGFQSKLVMWISASLLGIFSSPIWPSGLSWADRYIPVTATVVAVTDVGTGSGGAVCMWVAGRLVQTNQAYSYMYVAISACSACFAAITVLQVVGCRHGDRYHRQRTHIDVSSKSTTQEDQLMIN